LSAMYCRYALLYRSDAAFWYTYTIGCRPERGGAAPAALLGPDAELSPLLPPPAALRSSGLPALRPTSEPLRAARTPLPSRENSRRATDSRDGSIARTSYPRVAKSRV